MGILWFIEENTNPKKEFFVGPQGAASNWKAVVGGGGAMGCRSADQAIRNASSMPRGSSHVRPT